MPPVRGRVKVTDRGWATAKVTVGNKVVWRNDGPWHSVVESTREMTFSFRQLVSIGYRKGDFPSWDELVAAAQL